MNAKANDKNNQKPWLKPLGVIVVIIALLIIAKTLGLGEKLGLLKDWIRDLGPLAPLVFIGLYAVATVFAIPGSALTIMGGAIFGSLWGIVVVILGATLGATLAFLISRYFAREAIVKCLSGNEKFQKLDDLTKKHGAIIVAITRLVPIFPFNILNYGFGLTNVSLSTYVGWSFLCMIPGTALYVIGADAVVQGLQEGKIPWLLVGILVVVFVILSLIIKQARKKLKKDEQNG